MSNPKLKSNDHVKDFCDVSERDWTSLKSCNMLDKFYPFTTGISYAIDCNAYIQAKANLAATSAQVQVAVSRPARKPFSELCKTDYEKLFKLGLLWEVYPEASGNYDVDFPPKPKTIDVYIHGDNDQMYDIGTKLGLTDEALRNFIISLYEFKLTVEVDMVTGHIKMLQIDGDNIERFV